MKKRSRLRETGPSDTGCYIVTQNFEITVVKLNSTILVENNFKAITVISIKFFSPIIS